MAVCPIRLASLHVELGTQFCRRERMKDMEMEMNRSSTYLAASLPNSTSTGQADPSHPFCTKLCLMPINFSDSHKNDLPGIQPSTKSAPHTL